MMVKCVPKSDKKSEELPRKQFFRVDALAKHVEKDDSAKCGLIDSMGRRQKTIVINESGQGAGGPELKSSAVMAGF